MRIGSLFSGYGGLDLAVAQVYGASVAWHVEFDKHPSAILDAHFPDVPNYSDVTTVDWSSVEPVDILTGGFPCQDLSHAGKRAGLRPDTRSGLWEHMAYAINELQPGLVVIENVRGLLSAGAHSDVEPCPWCLGDEPTGVLRALGSVLGDLADLGYDARWGGIRAADAGAPHGRFRVFIVAYPNDGRRWEPDAQQQVFPFVDQNGDGPVTLLPTPKASNNDNQQNLDRYGLNLGMALMPERYDWSDAPQLLPTPQARDHKDAATFGSPGRWGDVDSVPRAIGQLLPTPRATDGTKGGPNQRGSSGDLMLPSAVQNFGPYAAAVARWEALLDRPAPAPTEPGNKGQPRLSPRFVEWMMGLPDGWVTDTGIPRNAQLKALGNGVVPQQAALALRLLGQVAA